MEDRVVDTNIVSYLLKGEHTIVDISSMSRGSF